MGWGSSLANLATGGIYGGVQAARGKNSKGSDSITQGIKSVGTAGILSEWGAEADPDVKNARSDELRMKEKDKQTWAATQPESKMGPNGRLYKHVDPRTFEVTYTADPTGQVSAIEDNGRKDPFDKAGDWVGDKVTDAVDAGKDLVSKGVKAGRDMLRGVTGGSGGSGIEGKLGGAMDEAGKMRQQFMTELGGYKAPTDAQMTGATIDPAAQEQIRKQQLGLLDMYQQQASGQGPSVAQQQLQQTLDRNVSNQFAMGAALGRGGNVGLAQRNAMANAANLNQQAAGDAATLRAQEMLAARQQYAQALEQTRGQDLSLAGQQAQFDQQTNAANLQSILQGRQLTEQERQNLRQAAITTQGSILGADTQRYGIDIGSRNALIGGLTSAAGGLLAAWAAK